MIPEKTFISSWILRALIWLNSCTDHTISAHPQCYSKVCGMLHNTVGQFCKVFHTCKTFYTN